MKAITPKEAEEAIPKVLPEILEVFNEMIKESFKKGTAVIWQDDVALVVARRFGISVQKVYEKKYLDVEDEYREAGWDVNYVKPPYYSEDRPYFVFKKAQDK